MSNVCAYDGWIVGGQREVPSDAHEYAWLGRAPVVGCSRLRCSVCGQVVKQRPGFLIPGTLAAFGSPEWRARVDALYDGGDWAALPFVKREPTYRLYVCRCGPVEESFERALSTTSVSGNPDGGDPIPWTCQGHPPLTLPAIVDGVAIADDVALAELTRRALGGWTPPSRAGAQTDRWPRRLLHHLEGGPAAAVVIGVARAALSDDRCDARVRLGAVELFRSVPDAEADAIVWRLAQDLDALARVRDDDGRSLDVAVIESVAKLWAADHLSGETVGAFVTRQAMAPGHARAVIPSIARRNIEWLRDNYAGVVRANPDCGGAVIKELFNALAYSGFRIEDVAHTVAATPGVSREQLRDYISKTLFGAARARVLDAIGAAPPN